MSFHNKFLPLMLKAKGSQHNHQAWEGGYLDHIFECFMIAESMYTSLCKIREVPFNISSVFIVLYFHDVEKIWKYSSGKVIDKNHYYQEDLPSGYGINFTPEEMNALQYIHGENADYTNKKRIMNELAAFCHAVDTLSARMWHDKGVCSEAENNPIDIDLCIVGETH